MAIRAGVHTIDLGGANSSPVHEAGTNNPMNVICIHSVEHRVTVMRVDSPRKLSRRYHTVSH